MERRNGELTISSLTLAIGLRGAEQGKARVNGASNTPADRPEAALQPSESHGIGNSSTNLRLEIVILQESFVTFL